MLFLLLITIDCTAVNISVDTSLDIGILLSHEQSTKTKNL